MKIINWLGKHKGKQITMHALSKAAKIPYATFHRTVNGMKGLVLLDTIGKAKAVSLNTANPIIKSYLSVSSEEEKNDFLEKQPIIRKIASELDTKEIVLLFGSYAKGREKESSDIDLMVVNSKGEKSISFSKYEVMFRKKINALFVAKSELRQMLRETGENVGKQALESHILLNNPEGFWGCVYG